MFTQGLFPLRSDPAPIVTAGSDGGDISKPLAGFFMAAAPLAIAAIGAIPNILEQFILQCGEHLEKGLADAASTFTVPLQGPSLGGPER